LEFEIYKEKQSMNRHLMNYKTFENYDGENPGSVYAVQLDGEIVSICHDERRCWSIANSYGTDNDGYPLAEVVMFSDLESAIDAYGGEDYIPTDALMALRRGKDWIA
jgi:hypothetical protein